MQVAKGNMSVARRSFIPETLLVSIPQAAARLGTTTSAIRGLIWDGQVRFVRLGKRHLIPLTELDAWIARNLQKNGV